MAFSLEEGRKYYERVGRERLEKAKEHLGGKCSRCESTDGLHFHHLRNKLFHISNGWGRDAEDFWREVEKCILLCKDCHKKEHAAPKHGYSAYTRGCRCDICFQAGRDYRQEKRRK